MNDKLKELTRNPSFCSMAWDHQFLDPTGRVKPCCRFDESQRPSEINLNNDSLSNLFFGDWMSGIREKMKKGEKVPGCRRCYEEENNGKKSLRQRYNENTTLPIDKLVDLKKPNIRWLELAISNACNLACRMCDSRYSLKWYDEEKSHWGQTKSPSKLTAIDIENVKPFIKDLVHIKFTGGEPLLTKEQWQIVDQLIEEADCKNVFLNYSTNCTIYPKKEWVEKWDQFKLVEFALSFDSADPKESEYIRWPAKYDTTVEATRAFLELGKRPNYHVLLRTTVSLLNVWHLPETILWWYENADFSPVIINPTHLTYPQILSVTVLPKKLKKRVEEKYQTYLQGDYPEKMKNSLRHILRYMNGTDHTPLLVKLYEYIEKTDAYRNQNFLESYPHFSDIFNGGVTADDAIYSKFQQDSSFATETQ